MWMELGLLVGLLGVASNPSPYFAALGLVGAAGMGCLLLVNGGVTFLSLVLFLIYLGGMMVVFAYCAALVAEPYPEAWGNYEVKAYLAVYSGILAVGWVFWGLINEDLSTPENCEVLLGEWWGVSELLGSGGWMMSLGGWGLLLTLFAVLEVVGGFKSGALRAV
uniref:NADH-ubiquinone oxidoreductase chain 6 n=1 Tax=Petropedetes sp. MVZ 234827 TaxID=1338816 RepID=S4V199_9NEOB|nr:NADH dehydrogenase subunit 6 [Petropedetes sp. MVZ 234827]